MAIVYQHRRKDTNEIFYIGIGKNTNRAYNKYSRSKVWKDVVFKTDYIVEILYNNLSWDEACLKEIQLIKLYGRKDLNLGTLVNLTDGGSGFNNVSKQVYSGNTSNVSSSRQVGNLVILSKGDKYFGHFYSVFELGQLQRFIRYSLSLIKENKLKFENMLWEDIRKVNLGTLMDGRKVLLLELQKK